MKIWTIVFLLGFTFIPLIALQNPTGFTSLYECINKGAYAVFPFEEKNENELKQFVLALENGTVVESGAIITQDGKLLSDTETYKSDQQCLLGQDRDISHEKHIFFDGTLAVISSPGQQCYYHWLLQVIPRLKVLEVSQMGYDKIYLDASNFIYRWQKESLYAVMDFLGIDHSRLFLIDGGTIVTAKTLIVPSILWTPAKNQFWVTDITWFKQFLKDVFVKQIEIESPKRVFISRSKAQYRHISNESHVIEFLAKKGFVSVHLEDLSLYDQAVLFNNAEVIIGPHGAGFANLIFCKPDTHIIEIDHGIKGEEPRSEYGAMAQRMECMYHPFYVDLLNETGLSEDISVPINYSTLQINQDMMVDIQAFEQFYNTISQFLCP